MEQTKPFYHSKTFWSGFGTIGVGIFQLFTGAIPTGILTIAGGAGAIFGRAKAKKQLTMKKEPQEVVVNPNG